jgi:hypothetical protein
VKVGDLVRFKDHPNVATSGRMLGIIVEVCAPPSARLVYNRIGVLWNDGNRIDWEPLNWLEVISESG